MDSRSISPSPPGPPGHFAAGQVFRSFARAADLLPVRPLAERAEGSAWPSADLPVIEGVDEFFAALADEGSKPQVGRIADGGRPAAVALGLQDAMPGPSRQAPPRVTAEMLRLAQDWVGSGPGRMTLAQFADGAGVPLTTLQTYVHADGSLTLRGEELRAGGVQGGQVQGVTADTVRQAQAAVASGQSLSGFAQANNVSLNGLRSALRADGTPIAGRVQPPGLRLQPANAEVVRRAQTAVSTGQSLKAFAQANNVSLRSLRHFVRSGGALTLGGAQLLAGGVQGGQLRGANAENIRQAQDAIAAGQTLEAFAGENGVSLNSLRHCIHANGTLTVLGAQVMAGGVRNGHLKGATAEVARQAQAAIAAGQTLAEFAQANDVALSSLKSVLRNDGALTKRGTRLLARHEGQPGGPAMT